MTIEPATDEQIEYWDENAELEVGLGIVSSNIHRLIARIRAEQAEKATARERAILECLNALNKVATAGFIIPDGVPACIKAVLALLQEEEQ